MADVEKNPKSKKSDKSLKSKKSEKSEKSKKKTSRSPSRKSSSSPKKEAGVGKTSRSHSRNSSVGIDKETTPPLQEINPIYVEQDQVIRPQTMPPIGSVRLGDVPRPAPQKLCGLHSLELKFYCEACEEPICADCQLMGPHNNELHRVTSIHDAFLSRFGRISSSAYSSLFRKRDLILHQIERIDQKIQEVKGVGNTVEKSVKSEYIETLERLKSTEGEKTAILQHEIALLQEDVKRIDSSLNFIDFHAQGEGKEDCVGFLQKFKEVHEYMDFAITKSFKTNTEVIPNDIPRELTAKRQKLELAGISEEFSKLKEDILWTLLQENKKISKLSDFEVEKQANSGWKQKVGQYSRELKKYEMICAFCKVPLDPHSVNSRCTANSSTLGVDPLQLPIKEVPPADFQGNQQHFFGKPKEISDGQLVLLESNSKASVAITTFKKAGYRKIEEIISKLQQLDTEKKGLVSEKQFGEVIKSNFTVIPDDSIIQLSSALIPENSASQKINYQEFFKQILKDLPPSPIYRRYNEGKDRVGSDYPLGYRPMFEAPIMPERKEERYFPMRMMPETSGIPIYSNPGSIKESSFYKASPSKLSEEIIPSDPRKVVQSSVNFSPVRNPYTPFGAGTGSVINSDSEAIKAIAGMMKRKNITKFDLLKVFKRFDLLSKGTITLDEFYLSFARLDIVITNKEIEFLALNWNPDIKRTNIFDYNDFLSKFPL